MPNPTPFELERMSQSVIKIPTATLKDLCPGDKAKIAQLMHKIIEQGQQLLDLQKDAVQQVGSCSRQTVVQQTVSFQLKGPQTKV